MGDFLYGFRAFLASPFRLPLLPRMTEDDLRGRLRTERALSATGHRTDYH